MLGMGMSAAATDARNCSVGALRLEAFLLLIRNRGLGGDGGCVSLFKVGSGVLGISSRRALRDQEAAKDWKCDMSDSRRSKVAQSLKSQ
jgi:hypothetical protein